jgi:hypothetical protein
VRDPLKGWTRKNKTLADTFSVRYPAVDRTGFGLKLVASCRPPGWAPLPALWRCGPPALNGMTPTWKPCAPASPPRGRNEPVQRSGIIHNELAGLIAGLRHTDTFVISDAGLPLAPGTVDLGYWYGQPLFLDVVEAVLAQWSSTAG